MDEPADGAAPGGAGPALELHMVGNAHIDPVWIWDWHEGMHEVLQTFRAALERLDDHPGLVFTASSAFYYQWVEAVDPPLFERIRAAVHAGRWDVVGGQWVEPDCNLPSGESVCRQLLYGQRYLSDRLGRPATVGYNVDSFGHAASLPQLFARSGLRAYVMMRPAEDEMPVAAPLFTWRGADGTELPTYRIPYEYATSFGPDAEEIRERSETLLERSRQLGVPLMVFFGVGDHGGGPTRRAIAAVDTLTAETSGALGYSSPSRYFDALASADAASDDAKERPVVDGELNRHAVGCYSAHPPVKRANSEAEVALSTAERIAELCRLVTGRDLDAAPSLAEAWRHVLFAQFHDALGGTCTEPAFEAVERMQAHALMVADRLTTLATHTVAQQIGTWADGAERADGLLSAVEGMPVPLVVFNPLSRAVRTFVSVPHPISVAIDAGGTRTPVQQLASGEVTYTATRAAFQAEVPAFGWQRYWLRAFEPEDGSAGPAPTTSVVTGRPAAPADHPTAGDAAGDGWMANDRVRCHVDPATGAVDELLDGAGGGNWLAGAMWAVVVEDPSDTWSHNVSRYEGDEQPFQVEWGKLVEVGPVRATYRVVSRFRSSTLVTDLSIYDGQPFVEVRLDLDWRDPFHLVKFVVPVAGTEPRTAAGAPYAHVERDPRGVEEPMVHWVDVTVARADGGTGGVACTADATYAYDADGGRVRLTVLRSPRFADHGMGWAEGDDTGGFPVSGLGRHRCSFRVHPHEGGWAEAGVALLAEDHRTGFPLVLDTWHDGPLGATWSGVTVESGSVAVGAVKRAEGGGGSVLRVWEPVGTACTARLDLSAYGRHYEGDFGPHEVKTLYLPDDPTAPVQEVDIPELSVSPRGPA
jgi:alpha-mannosidase